MKKRNASTLLVFVFLLTIPFFLSAQSTAPVWKQLKQENGVTVSYQVTNCGGKDFLLYKVENTTFHPVTVSNVLNIKGSAGTIIQKILPRPIRIEPSKTVTGSCSLLTDALTNPLPHDSSYTVEVVQIMIQ